VEALAPAGGGAFGVRRVVLTGGESTGKTTLAGELARAFHTVASPEYARLYVEARRAPLTADDVEPIARGQIAREDEAEASARVVVFKDTDLVSTVVYARHYYGACPTWIEAAARARLADLYLLLHPDVPWVADGDARDLPHARSEIHARLREALAELGAAVVEISGGWEERKVMAAEAVAALLARITPPG
jgi:NadR type nicotinamide-nucleotide adenylyltransferase